MLNMCAEVELEPSTGKATTATLNSTRNIDRPQKRGRRTHKPIGGNPSAFGLLNKIPTCKKTKGQ